MHYEIGKKKKPTIIRVCVRVCVHASTASSVCCTLPMKALQGGAHISCSWTAGHCRLTSSLDWEKVRKPPPCLPTVAWQCRPLSFSCQPNPGVRLVLNTKEVTMGEKRSSARWDWKDHHHGWVGACLRKPRINVKLKELHSNWSVIHLLLAPWKRQ